MSEFGETPFRTDAECAQERAPCKQEQGGSRTGRASWRDRQFDVWETLGNTEGNDIRKVQRLADFPSVRKR